MVIESHPRLEDGSPFPTTFWLTCPILSKRVSTLEGDGRMTELNGRLASDGAARDRLAAAIAAYITRRDEHERIEGDIPGGGPERVKCLHAHTAHELVSGANPAGSWSLSQAGFPDCRQACYEVSER